MAKSIQLKFAVALCWVFALVSSITVYAAETVKPVGGLSAIPLDDINRCLLIIFFGGLLATLMKMTAANPPYIRSLTLEIFKDSVGSFVAGLIGYLVVNWIDQEYTKIHILLQPCIIFFCAFGGSRLIEPVYNEGVTGFLTMFRAFLSRLIGRQNPPAPPASNDPNP